MKLKSIKQITKFFTWVAVLILIASVAGAAEEVDYLVPGYTAEELAEVREWEKKWVGKKVDKTNVDQVAEFLPESYVGIYKNPDKWGAPPEGLFFNIGANRPVAATPGMIESTKKYSKLVETDKDGTIINYKELAGFPFPNPKTGRELAYNKEFNTDGDGDHNRQYSPTINPKKRTDRFADSENWNLHYVQRCDVEPKPALPDNIKGYRKGQFMHMYLPPEMLNTRMFTMRFIDAKKQDDQYLYYAQYRRIRRMATSERENSIDGTDMIYDDANQWDGHYSRNTYKYLGRKDMLSARHQRSDEVVRKTGQAIPNEITLERCNLYVVEVQSKNPNYIYKKRIWYLDPESFYIMWQDMYDKQDRFWKTFMLLTSDYKTEQGHMRSMISGQVLQDFQRNHSGYSSYKRLETGANISTNMFSMSNLQKTY
jgi:hypothetical protein